MKKHRDRRRDSRLNRVVPHDEHGVQANISDEVEYRVEEDESALLAHQQDLSNLPEGGVDYHAGAEHKQQVVLSGVRTEQAQQFPTEEEEDNQPAKRRRDRHVADEVVLGEEKVDLVLREELRDARLSHVAQDLLAVSQYGGDFPRYVVPSRRRRGGERRQEQHVDVFDQLASDGIQEEDGRELELFTGDSAEIQVLPPLRDGGEPDEWQIKRQADRGGDGPRPRDEQVDGGHSAETEHFAGDLFERDRRRDAFESAEHPAGDR